MMAMEVPGVSGDIASLFGLHYAFCHTKHLFPVEVNRAPLEILLRVPGIGAKSAQKILSARRYATLAFEHLKKMRVVLKRARHFITAGGKFYGSDSPSAVRGLLTAGEARENARQLSLFDSPSSLGMPLRLEAARSALTGEL